MKGRSRMLLVLGSSLVLAACSSGSFRGVGDAGEDSGALAPPPGTDAGPRAEQDGDGGTDAPSDANLLANPSLESWGTGTEPNTPPDGWTDCTSGGGIAVDAVPDSCDATPAAGSEGRRYARAVEGEGIAQTVPTVIGVTYVVSFDHAAVSDCFGGPSDASWSVVVDGKVLFTTPGGESTAWKEATRTFVATSASTTLCFRKAEAGQGGIDHLRLAAK